MKLSHTLTATTAVFDDPNLVSAGGLVPVLALADSAGLRQLADEHLSVPSDKGANSGLKVALAGRRDGRRCGLDRRHGPVAARRDGADLSLGATPRQRWARSCAHFTFGHVRQLDAIASRFLIALAGLTRLLDASVASDTGPDAVAGYALLDVDDTIIEVHGHAKQGAGFGYSGVRGLNALLATLATATAAPVIVAQRLRKGSAGSPRGAKHLGRRRGEHDPGGYLA